MLARAFWNDPTSLLAYPEEKDRQSHLHYLFEFLLRLYFDDTEAYITSEKLEGIAIWRRIGSQKPSVSFWQFIRTGAIWPGLKMGLENAKRMVPFSEFMERKHQELGLKHDQDTEDNTLYYKTKHNIKDKPLLGFYCFDAFEYWDENSINSSIGSMLI